MNFVELDRFFNTLFNMGDYTCFAQLNKGTAVFPAGSVKGKLHWAKLFGLNPLHGSKDLNPTQPYHNQDKPRRCDANVVTFRNFLVEMDNFTLDKQKELIKESGLPYTSAVYSGNKSIHWVVALKEPIATEVEYRKIATRMFRALGGKRVVDMQCKNPSRMSRIPFVQRPETGKMQELLELKERVDTAELLAWIEREVGPEKPEDALMEVINDRQGAISQGRKRALRGSTLNFIMEGANQGERNLMLFRAACDFAQCGYSETETNGQLERPSGLDREEVSRTVRSAFARVKYAT